MEQLPQQMNLASKLLDMFGEYGPVWLMMCVILLILVAVLWWSGRRTDRQMAASNAQVAGFTTAIAQQSKDISEAVRTGLEKQASDFLSALNSIRADHHADRERDRADRERMLGTIERLATPPAIKIVAPKPRRKAA